MRRFGGVFDAYDYRLLAFARMAVGKWELWWWPAMKQGYA